jgi:hypothetical protein
MAAAVLDLRYDDLAFRIVATDLSHLAWLRECLLPQCTPGAGPSPVRVELIADDSLYRSLSALTRTGKTTLMIFACLHGGARFMVNDRVLIARGASAWLVRGVPTVVTVRPGTLDYFPDLRRRIAAERPHAIFTAAECADGVLSPPLFDDRGKHWLLPAQLRGLLGTEPAAAAEDPVVVIPRITGKPGTFVLRPLDAGEAFGLLQGAFFGARHWAGSTPIFAAGLREAGAPAVPLEERWREFTSVHPCLLCEIGDDLFDRRENAAAWLRAVRDEAARTGLR